MNWRWLISSLLVLCILAGCSAVPEDGSLTYVDPNNGWSMTFSATDEFAHGYDDVSLHYRSVDMNSALVFADWWAPTDADVIGEQDGFNAGIDGITILLPEKTSQVCGLLYGQPMTNIEYWCDSYTDTTTAEFSATITLEDNTMRYAVGKCFISDGTAVLLYRISTEKEHESLDQTLEGLYATFKPKEVT